MFTVLIVDDNTMIRQSIRKRIPWQSLQMTCIGEAENGEQAHLMIEQLQPDIVITDIKMPKADGFFAIRQTREQHPEIQFIVISGYDDFTYLKQSVQLQVLDYILKPINTEELTESLQRAAARIQQHKKAQTFERAAHHYKSLYDRRKLESAFLQFFSFHMESNVFFEQLHQQPYPFLKSYCQCILINFPTTQHTHILSGDQIEHLESQIEQITYPSNCLVIPLYHETYAVILSKDEDTSISRVLLEQIQQAVCAISTPIFPCYLSCGMTVTNNKLRESYQDAILQMLYRFIPEFSETKIFAEHDTSSAFESLSFQSEWKIAFELQMFDECKRILCQVVEKSSRSFQLFLASMRSLLDTMNHMLYQKLGQPLFIQHTLELYLLMFASREALMQALCSILDKLEPECPDYDLGERVVRYLHENYTKPLTLQSLSELFHVNQIYLGQIIKKKTGQSFNTLINSLRVKSAAQNICENPNISFKNLAFSLGFTDSHYFTKVFKQYHGVTPSEYRTHILSENTDPKK